MPLNSFKSKGVIFMSKLKVEGKVGDFCPNCKNCKAVTRMHDGKNTSIRITEVECVDPYDGMVKTLDVDSDICCSMFEPKKEKESFNLNMPSRIISEEEYNELKKSRDGWRERYYEVRYALRKDETLDESISCVRDIPSDVEMIEDLKKRAADSDYYKEESELLEERNNNQFNTIREKNKKISELEALLKYWSNKAVAHSEKLTETKKDRDKWRELYNSLSEICSDYDKRCKEECEKKYRDEISKLQNIVTEKEVEIKGLRKDNARLSKDISWGNMIAEKNSELNQTISCQEVTIKALLITIKEICKEDRERMKSLLNGEEPMDDE